MVTDKIEKILVIDDEVTFVKGLKLQLENHGLSVETSHNGLDGLDKIKENEYSLVVLDLMLPGMDGIEVCRRIRDFSVVPIIMLTAKEDEIEKILGLEVGADDYLNKPFNFRELLARIKALLRRVSWDDTDKEEKQQIKKYTTPIGNLSIQLDTRKTFLDSKEIILSTKEFEIFTLLSHFPGKIFSRDELLDKVWGYDYYGSPRTVDVHMRRLRAKIEAEPEEPQIICTKWGMGYYFNGQRR
ncbi:MAG: PhoP family transcriptional regulator [Desulfitibacter sp. BRH_c19]|nr:MAG: PhoP family transcriptional regulator [Desulfitibacter sp. BRH_c19]